MKRFAPLVLLVSCAPSAADRPPAVVRAPSPSAATAAAASATVAAVPSASPAAAPVAKNDELPPNTPVTSVPVRHRLAANGWQSCAVRNDGTVSCWGAGSVHDLPQQGVELATPLRPVTIGGLSGATDVATAVRAACALRKDGAVACWGSGVLPGGATLERTKAQAVPGLAPASRVFAHDHRVCAIVATGKVACFGFQGSPIDEKPLPVAAADVVDAAGGSTHACLVVNDGTVRCWGSNGLGGVGGDAKDDAFVRVPEVNDAIAVTVSGSFTCAVLATGYRSCWGNGHPLGGGYAGGTYPVVTSKAKNHVARAAAGRTTCWLQRDGKVACEGKGDFGQLGTGELFGASRALVSGLDDAVEIAVGLEHACALRANGDVACWGANDRGQVGDGTLVDRTVPTGVLGLGGKEPAPSKPGTGAPIVAKVAAGPVASWREPDGGWARRVDATGWGSSKPAPSAVGTKAALFQAQGLALHEDHGLVGPIAWPPAASFVGLDGDDAVWVGTQDAVLRAPDVLAAKAGAFQKVLAISYPVAFASTKGMVVAATSTTLHVSKDSGKTFTKIAPKQDLTIEDVFARPDGLLAILGRDAAGEVSLWIAKDGATFVRSSVQSARVGQVGSHLYVNGCPGGILSSDGTIWNRWDEEYRAPFSFSAWATPLEVSSWPRAFTSTTWPNLASPPPPAPDPKGSIKGAPGACTHGPGGAIGIGGLGRGRRAGACVGASCIRGSLGELPRETPTELAFYADGACERDAKGACTDAPWRRAPHVWLKGSKAPIAVPAGCDPIRMTSAGGVGALFCRSGSSMAVHTIAKDGTFHAEGTVPAQTIEDVTIAADGTLVVHPRCGAKDHGQTGACPAALVRAPSPLGAASAWRSTTVPRAYAYRVLPSGHALVVAGIEGDPQKLSLVVDRPGKPPLTLANVTLTGDLIDLVVEKDRIVVTEQITSRKPFRSWIAADGLVRVVEAPKGTATSKTK